MYAPPMAIIPMRIYVDLADDMNEATEPPNETTELIILVIAAMTFLLNYKPSTGFL
tara:strand:+ start:43468 stop:43635 length:168 start_codon:yes stop_codon:yes gene_type:complete